MKEATLENDIVQYLIYCGYMAWKTHDAKHRPCVAGMPDVLAVKKGKILAVEVKRPGCKTTEVQNDFLSRLRHFGAKAIVATSLADVQEGKL